jgi:perosamine synthetase
MKISLVQPNIGEKEREYVNNALKSGWIGGKGEYIDRFEEKFAKYIGVEHAITCSSGTTALQLAYLASGIHSTSKITVPDTTFRATWNMARLYTPNVIEKKVEDDTWVIKLENLESEFVVGVHLYGNPVDMGQVYRNKYVFIEDCAQSLGSTHRGKKTGSFGTTSIFSFHSAKTMTTGEGGMVCTNSKLIADKVREQPYVHNGLGFNFRMTNLQAALGLAQLERLEELLSLKRYITKFYNENLDKSFQRQVITPKSSAIFWLNTYKHPQANHLRRELGAMDIETRPGFLGDNYISLPSSTTITQGELEYVVSQANNLVKD